MTLIIVFMLILGYLLIATGHLTGVNKAAIAMFIGTVGWVVYICWGTDFVTDQHPDDYPVILVANINQQKLFLIASSVPLGAYGKQSFEVSLKPYGQERDEFSGFMFVTSQSRSKVGFGTMGVAKRPARPPKKKKDEKDEKQPSPNNQSTKTQP